MTRQTSKPWRGPGLLMLGLLFSSPAMPAPAGQWIEPTGIAWVAALGAITMWGGDDVSLLADGPIVLQATFHNSEERYIGTLEAPAVDDIRRTVAAHDFRQAPQPHPSYTDAMGELLCVGLADGRVLACHIIGGTTDPHFGAVEQAMAKLARQVPRAAAVYTGACQHPWQPADIPMGARTACSRAHEETAAAR